jgi:uncharacterized protein YbaR (Trm112 family)
MSNNKEILDILVCPTDKNELIIRSSSLVCKKCGNKYRIKEGIFMLLPNNKKN